MCRDAAAGVDIAAAIYDGIRHSKTTIILVGRTYSQDLWLPYMFRAAKQFAKDCPLHHLIIILMSENMVAVCRRDKLLKAYIQLGQYIVITHHLFWQRLLTHLDAGYRSNNSLSNGEQRMLSPLILHDIRRVGRDHDHVETETIRL